MTDKSSSLRDESPPGPRIVVGDDRSGPVSWGEGRFARLEAIPWWDQPRIRRARILVLGAGALGNEAIKNLALLGIGHLIIADMDRIEASNLCRSVLFRIADEGQPKAAAAARAVNDIDPDIQAVSRIGNIMSDLGLGHFRWADVVLGCLDNREARVFVNRACAQVGRPWIDGGIDVLNGVVRGFAPPDTACYECTMGQTDWDLLNKRRSCSLLARQALAQNGTPTTPTTASIIGALQAQEAVKRLHRLEWLAGEGFVLEGLRHQSYSVKYPISPDCPWHEPPAPIVDMPDADSDTPLRTIWARAEERLGALDAIDLSRELVEKLECPACGETRAVLQPIERIQEREAICKRCGGECAPRFLHSIPAGSALLDSTPRRIGLPAWEIVWARRGEDLLGIEFSGDRPPELSESVTAERERRAGAG